MIFSPLLSSSHRLQKISCKKILLINTHTIFIFFFFLILLREVFVFVFISNNNSFCLNSTLSLFYTYTTQSRQHHLIISFWFDFNLVIKLVNHQPRRITYQQQIHNFFLIYHYFNKISRFSKVYTTPQPSITLSL